MQQIKASQGSCSFSMMGFGMLVFVVYQFGHFIYSTWVFFQRPDVVARIIELLQACGICVGLLVLALVIMIILPPPKRIHGEEYEDW